MKIFQLKYFAIVELVLSIASVFIIFLTLSELLRGNLLVIEQLVTAIVGVVASVLLLINNKIGVFLSRIWTVMQIPFLGLTVGGITYPITFTTAIHLQFNYGIYIENVSFFLGVNFIGLALFMILKKSLKNRKVEESITNNVPVVTQNVQPENNPIIPNNPPKSV